MLRDDYILRMIEQIGRLAARLREMLLRGDPISDLEVKETAAAAGFDLGLLRLLTTDSLGSLVNPTGHPDALRNVLAAELLFADALVAQSRGDEAAAADRLDKVAHLVAAAGQDSDGVRRALVTKRIAALREELSTAAAPEHESEL